MYASITVMVMKTLDCLHILRISFVNRFVNGFVVIILDRKQALKQKELTGNR